MKKKPWLLAGKRIEGTRETADRLYVRFRARGREPSEKAVPLDKRLFRTRTELAERVRELRSEQARGALDVWTDSLTGTGHLAGGRPWTGDLAAEDAIGSAPLLLHVERYCLAKREAGKRGERGGWGRKTHANAKALLLTFCRQFGELRPLGELRAEDLARYVHAPDTAGHAVSAAYKDSRWRALRTFVSYLQEKGLAPGGLAMPPRVRLARRVRDYVTPEELEAICAAHEAQITGQAARPHVSESSWRASPLARRWQQEAFRLAFYQTLRRAEVVNMRWAWIDMEAEALTIGDEHFRPKSGHDRTVPITPPAFAVVRRAREAAAREGEPDPTAYVFRPRSRNRSSLAERLSTAFRAARREVLPGSTDVNFHALRRSGSIYLQKIGLSESDVADLMGHSDVKITRRHYDEVDASAMRERMRRAFDA